MAAESVNVYITLVADCTLVECERCGPVGVGFHITAQMAAYHHLVSEHGMNIMEEHK